MKKKTVVLFAFAALLAVSALSASAAETGPIEGPWLNLPEFDAEIDGELSNTDANGTVVYNRVVNGGELNLIVERVSMKEITEQAILDTIARRESIDADEIALSDASELMEEFSYEYPCVSATYEAADGARENSELIFPIGEYILRLIISIRADAETDYESDDMLFKWISKIEFVNVGTDDPGGGKSAPNTSAMSDSEFLEFCEEATPEEIERAIEAGANVMARNDDGETTLHRAIEYNEYPKAAIALIEGGADVNARDGENRTPLMKAAEEREDDIDALTGLILAGAEVNAADGDDWTALHYAARNNDNPEVTKTLLERGADPKATDDGGMIPLMWAANNNGIPVISLLLEAGSDIGDKSGDGETPLMLAAMGNQPPEVISFLLERGADISDRDNSGKTVLSHAARHSPHPAVVELLLTRGANINEQDGSGKTALMEACGAGTPRGVNNALLLLDKGADANIKDSEGKKAADYLPESKPDEAGDGEWKALVDRLAGK